MATPYVRIVRNRSSDSCFPSAVACLSTHVGHFALFLRVPVQKVAGKLHAPLFQNSRSTYLGMRTELEAAIQHIDSWRDESSALQVWLHAAICSANTRANKTRKVHFFGKVHIVAQRLARPVAGVDGKLALKSWRRPRGLLALEEIISSKVSTREILSLKVDARCVEKKTTFQKCTFRLLPYLEEFF